MDGPASPILRFLGRKGVASAVAALAAVGTVGGASLALSGGTTSASTNVALPVESGPGSSVACPLGANPCCPSIAVPPAAGTGAVAAGGGVMDAKHWWRKGSGLVRCCPRAVAGSSGGSVEGAALSSPPRSRASTCCPSSLAGPGQVPPVPPTCCPSPLAGSGQDGSDGAGSEQPGALRCDIRREVAHLVQEAVHGDLVVPARALGALGASPGVTSTSGYVTVAFDRGTVESISASSVTLERPDGVAVTDSLSPSTLEPRGAPVVGEEAILVSVGSRALVLLALPASTHAPGGARLSARGIMGGRGPSS
jgi:hypothetical protein